MEEKKIIEMENEVKVNEVETVEESKLEKIKNSKPAQFMKKHGKKLAIAAGVGAAFLIGRALGEKDGFELAVSSDSDNNGDNDVIEIEDYSVEEVSGNEEE